MRILLATVILLLGASAHAREAVNGLSQSEARSRAAAVSQVAYDLDVSIDSASAAYSGRETIAFSYEGGEEPLTVDFDGGAVASLSVDEAALSTAAYNGLFLTVPADRLRRGRNTITVSWTHPYSATGEGFYRFVDPEDGRVYLYTDFEPYDANRLLPCFDQPDLKAAFTLRVRAPSDWTVVSTTRESSVQEDGEGRRSWTFPTSPRISPYVFSLHAGQYHVWTSTAGWVPLRLFAREALAPYVDPEEWFQLTRDGLGFYGRYFALAYPFGKYDQLIVPDYNGSAMENVAAVTFSETYVRRGKRTRYERELLADTLLHEMAHMWFGDLVTCRWWDGLWLNESFASYMASLATAEATPFTEAWRSFFIEEKTWAYREDQQPSTHPIQADVPDTQTAFANFDGITYGKGASALKQLAHRLGDEVFRDGVRSFLAEHASGVVSERDFFAALERASGADLKAWTKAWLGTAGVDTVSAAPVCGRGGGLESLSVRPSHDGAGGPRPHSADVGLYDGHLKLLRKLQADYSGPQDVPGAGGAPCPALVFPNAGDFDYVKVRLDSRSLAAAARVSDASDPLLRAMLWQSLWELVRDGRFKPSAFARLALGQLGRESDYETANHVLSTLYTAPAVFDYLAAPMARDFEPAFASLLAKAEPGGDLQKLWFDAAVAVATSPDALGRLERWLSEPPAGMTIDQERRWEILKRLSAMGATGVAALIDAEAARDRTSKGIKAALAARAAAPDEAVKRRWFEVFTDSSSAVSLDAMRAAMEALFPREQKRLRERFARDFFAALPKLAASKDDEFLSAFTRNLAPTLCSKASVAVIDGFLKDHRSLPPAVSRNLVVARAEDRRCVAARALDAGR